MERPHYYWQVQIVKTFIIPIFLYRASMICLDKEFVKEANKIIFNFIWKGKEKIKRLALISDIKDGELKAPHLDSIMKTQRILCCKRLASEQPSSWKTILLHYLEPVGGKFIPCCDHNIKTLPIKLPMFYEECLYPIQTRLFWSICDGGAPRTPPLCISGTNNATVMKFTHNDHLRIKKPHTQF